MPARALEKCSKFELRRLGGVTSVTCVLNEFPALISELSQFHSSSMSKPVLRLLAVRGYLDNGAQTPFLSSPLHLHLHYIRFIT